MPGPLDLTKLFQLSKIQLYLDGNPTPYVAEITLPAINTPAEEFNNTSTGGAVMVSDPNRYSVDGEGEIKFEAADRQVYSAIFNASKVVSMTIAMAVNAMNPQLGQYLPLPVSYKIGAQFTGPDLGAIAPGAKQEVTAKFNLMSLKIEYNLITVIDYDFVNGTFLNDGADLLSAVQNIL